MSSNQPRSVLVGTDLSPASDTVVRAAAELAAISGAQLHLVHATELPLTPYTEQGIELYGFREQLAACRSALDEQAVRVVPTGVEVGSREALLYAAHRAILERAAEVEADLIVIGPHRQHRAADFLLGSTAESVVRGARVPCLVVRAPLALPLREVVVPLDLSELARGALDEALTWAARLAAGDPLQGLPATDVRVIHVIPKAFQTPDFPFDRAVVGPELHREVAAALERVPGGSTLEVREELIWGDDAAEEITRFAAAENADLLVIGTRGFGAVKRILLGSTSAGVVRRATCNVLLVPPALWREERPH